MNLISPWKHREHGGIKLFSPRSPWLLGDQVLAQLDYQARSIRIKQPQPRMAMEYRVELEVYNGPLDLLLYLIKKDELDIYDIPIARITDTYMQYVSMLKEMAGEGLDINVAGDFLVMAATLMEIKSATLLPKPPP